MSALRLPEDSFDMRSYGAQPDAFFPFVQPHESSPERQKNSPRRTSDSGNEDRSDTAYDMSREGGHSFMRHLPTTVHMCPLPHPSTSS